MKKHTLLFLLCLIGMPGILMAQEYKTCTATYTYHASLNESLEQARQKAINLARTEALREAFGSVVSGASASSLIRKNNITSSKFVSLNSEGEVNGEWVADIDEPEVRPELLSTGIVVHVKVKGKGMEITNNKIAFNAHILRNAPLPENESSEFVAGNDFFVSFNSPVDGYLAVYLLDGETAYCLLPYATNKEGFFHVNSNQDYMLFSRRHPATDENAQEIEEYSLTASDGCEELNQFYFIFSPNKFRKPADSSRQDDDGTVYPRELTWEAFQKWIMKVRRSDRDMAVKTQYVVIKPRNN